MQKHGQKANKQFPYRFQLVIDEIGIMEAVFRQESDELNDKADSLVVCGPIYIAQTGK